MKSEKEPSLWPLMLFGTLLFALWPSKRNQPAETIHPQDNAQVKGNLVPGATTVISNIPPSPPNGGNTNRSKDDTPPWKKRVEIGAVLIAFGLLLVNICQMRSTEKAANTSRKELELSERPWLTAKLSVGKDGLTFKEDGTGSFHSSLVIKNIGHSPAVNFATAQKMILIPQGGKRKNWLTPLHVQKEICDELRGREPPRRAVDILFPGEEIPPGEIEFPVTEEMLDLGKIVITEPVGLTQQFDAAVSGTYIIPVIVGCVDYKFTFSPEHHQTGFVYTLGGYMPDIPDIPAYIKLGPSYPANKLILVPEFYGGKYAD